MGLLTIFHGSPYVIKKPIYGKSAVVTDYGKGFYCTEHFSLGAEWACKLNKDGYVNEYQIDTNTLRILRLDEKYNILQWLAILVDNRDVPANAYQAKEYLTKYFLIPDYKEYDIIIGYRADDSYFTSVRDFLQNSIGIDILSEAMYLGDLGLQVFIQSKRAFDGVKYIKSHPVRNEEYFPNQRKRQENAEVKYEEFLKNPYKGKMIIDYIREGDGYDRESIQRINITHR